MLRLMDASEAINAPSSTEDALLTPRDVARKLAISEETLTTWRCTRRQHIPYVKVGHLVRYRPADVSAFIESRLQAA